MEMTNHPITLPLEASVTRCLANWSKPLEYCPRREDCAAHVTIRHDSRPSENVQSRKCLSDLHVGFVPLRGFGNAEE